MVANMLRLLSHLNSNCLKNKQTNEEAEGEGGGEERDNVKVLAISTFSPVDSDLKQSEN